MLYLTCTTISSVDLAQYGVALAKDWVSVECGTMLPKAKFFSYRIFPFRRVAWFGRTNMKSQKLFLFVIKVRNVEMSSATITCYLPRPAPASPSYLLH